MSTNRLEFCGVGLDISDHFDYDKYDEIETVLSKRKLDLEDTDRMGGGKKLIFFHLAKSDIYEGFEYTTFDFNYLFEDLLSKRELIAETASELFDMDYSEAFENVKLMIFSDWG